MSNENQVPAPQPSPEPEGRPRASRSRRRQGRKWLWISLGILVVILGAAALGGRPVWRAVKNARAERFVNESEAFIRQEKWSEAFQRARSALQLAPTNPRVLRLTATLYGAANLELAFPYYETLLQTPAATAGDRENLAALALRLGNGDIATTQVNALLQSARRSSRTLSLAAQLQVNRRDIVSAVRYAREAVQVEPGNPTNILALANYLTRTGQAAERKESLDILWPLATTNGPSQLSALSAILYFPKSPREDRERVIGVLDAKPRRNLQEELFLHEARVSIDPSLRLRIADELVERFGHGTGQEIAALSIWLNRQQLFPRTLGVLLPDIAASDPTLCRIRYDALIGNQDYRGAYDFIRRDVKFRDPFQLELLRCSAAIRLKDKRISDMHFNNLLEMASKDPRQLRSVADFAIRNGNREIAGQAAQRLARNPRDAAQAYAALVQVADAQGETWVARDYARKLLKLRANDETVQLQVAYYDLLLGENLDEALASLKALHENRPGDFSRRAVLGFAYFRLNKPREGVALIDGIPVTFERLPVGIRVCAIAILGANDRVPAATKLIADVPLARLKPEEREILRPYITGALPALDTNPLGDDDPAAAPGGPEPPSP